MDRRRFIGSALYFTVASAGFGLGACSGGNDNDGAPPPGSFSFPLGVASGDPRESSIVFWTRCLGPGPAPVDLRLEVAASPAFDSIVASVNLTAIPAYDFTVRAKVAGLAPATTYHYRFVAGRDASAIGQSRTAPAATATPTQLRFAWITCQDWSVNHWAAFDLLAAEELDFVVHVGDYVYETIGAAFQSGQAEPAHPRITLPNGVAGGGSEGGIHAATLEDYRTLYRTYRGDKRLQEVHRKFPMIAIWDDHEFSNDCWQEHQTYDNSNAPEPGRRRSANQAWAEYMPVDFGDVSFDLGNPGWDNIRIYRDFRFGTLLHLVMTDERLYRDDHVISEKALASLLGHDTEHGDDRIGARIVVLQSLLREFERIDTRTLGHVPSILGQAQSQWWKDTMKNSGARWKAWGNEVTLNRLWLDLRNKVPPPLDQQYVLDADAWDGYPSHRGDLIGYLKAQGIANVVALTGDLHAFQCGVIRDNPDPTVGTAVAVDFVAAGVSSSSLYASLRQGIGGSALETLLGSPAEFDALLRGQNPDLAYADHDAQGYALASVTADAFTVTFNKVKPLDAGGVAPAAPLAKRTRITLAAGSTTPVVEDNV
ncbi:MAG: alkaline phosphatase D family protein [Massilia sp.]